MEGNREDVRNAILEMQKKAFRDAFADAKARNFGDKELQELKSAFQEFLQMEEIVYREDGLYHFREIVNRIPRNIWVQIMQDTSYKIKSRIREEEY
ncbi:MAG: hypothetical protein V1896_02310 [Candidatus Zambryskibacteria bacterium]